MGGELIAEGGVEGEVVTLEAVEMGREEVADEVEANAESAAADLEDVGGGGKGSGRSEELEDIAATGPGFAIVGMVLLDQELRRARERSVGGCVGVLIVGDALEVNEILELLGAGAGIDALAKGVPAGRRGGRISEGVEFD